MTMENYLIPASLLQEVLTYLSMRPYREVAPAMEALRQLDVAQQNQAADAE
jgi:hypothetical protein